MAEKARRRRRTKTATKMNRLADILKIIGGLLLLFSATVTFKFDGLDKIAVITDEGNKFSIDDLIYFRGILLGSLCIIFGSALTSKNHTVQNLLFSFCAGLFSLIIVSTYNLVADKLIDLDFYFDITMIITITTMVIITVLRLWARYMTLKQ